MAICPYPFALSSENPRNPGMAVACGKCSVCRLNQKRQKTARMLLESMQHRSAYLLTCTYEDWHAPMDPYGQQVLVKSDVQKYIKLLRHHTPVAKYAWCGEYGRRRTKRPHYHLVLFGSDAPDLYRDKWPHGHVDVKVCNPKGYAYVTGYVMKKCEADDEDIMDRPAEFFHWSHGMGAGAVPRLVDAFKGMAMPRQFRMYGKWWPIDRYLRRMVEIEYAKRNGGELIQWAEYENLESLEAMKRSEVLEKRLMATAPNGTF